MGRRGYPPEFRRKVLDLVEAGRPVVDVAKRGIFIPNPESLGEIAQKTAPAGTRIVLIQPVGAVLNTGDACALLVPPINGVVKARAKRQISRRLKLKAVKRYDKLGRDCTALAGLAIKLAEDGDIPAAEAVNPQTVELTRVFQFYVSKFRRRNVKRLAEHGVVRSRQEQDLRHSLDLDAGDMVPPTPIVLALSELVQQRAFDKEPGAAPAISILNRLIAGSDPSDGMAPRMLSALHRVNATDRDEQLALCDLAIHVGLRSLEVADSMTFGRAVQFLGRYVDDRSPCASAILASRSAPYAVTFWTQAYEGLDSALTDRSSSVNAILEYCYVGASALHVGNLPAAFGIADRLSRVEGIVDHLEKLDNRSSISSMSFRASLVGLVLGSSPADALSQFVRFCIKLSPSTRPVSP